MNVFVTPDNFDYNNIFYSDSIKNTVIDNSSFIRIMYSNDLFILNGIYLKINFNEIYLENVNYKFKYNFNIEKNLKLLNYIKELEYNLLKGVNIKNKILSTKFYDQLKCGFIKITGDGENVDTKSYILKISGIWESPYEYGLTYKIIDINKIIDYPSVE